MSQLLLPGDFGFSDWLSIPPPDAKLHPSENGNQILLAADPESGILMPVKMAELKELAFDGGYYQDDE